MAAVRRDHGQPGVGRAGALREPARARRQLRRAAGASCRSGAASSRSQELYEAAQQRRVPFAPVSTMGDLLDSPHLRRAASSRRSTTPQAGAVTMPGRAVPAVARRRGRCGARRRGSGSTPPRCSPRSASTPRRCIARGRRAMSRRRAARRHPRRRLHLGVGRAVLHAPARAPRRRGDPRRERDAHSASRACCRRSRDFEPGPNRSGYFNQYNQGKRASRST